MEYESREGVLQKSEMPRKKLFPISVLIDIDYSKESI